MYRLWLDAKNFGSGSSKTCSTFDSPVLASSEEFAFDELEGSKSTIR
jgi:hypothetical protein